MTAGPDLPDQLSSASDHQIIITVNRDEPSNEFISVTWVAVLCTAMYYCFVLLCSAMKCFEVLCSEVISAIDF